MKYLLIITTILLSKFCYSQQFYNRTLGTTTPNDPFLSSSRAFYMPRSLDTTLNGGLDSIGALTYDRIRRKIWIRDSVLLGGHKWTQIFKQDDTATTLATRYDLTQLSFPNSNIGSGYRWAVPNTNNIKTVFDSNTILWDSTSNLNGLTAKADTSVLATQYDISGFASGSASANQITYWTGPSTIGGDAGMTVDASTNTLISDSLRTKQLRTIPDSTVSHKLVFIEGDTSIPTFTHSLQHFNVNPDYPTRPNAVYSMGFNWDNGKPYYGYFRDGWEWNYEPFPGANYTQYERHIGEYRIGGNVIRPISFTARTDQRASVLLNRFGLYQFFDDRDSLVMDMGQTDVIDIKQSNFRITPLTSSGNTGLFWVSSNADGTTNISNTASTAINSFGFNSNVTFNQRFFTSNSIGVQADVRTFAINQTASTQGVIRFTQASLTTNNAGISTNGSSVVQYFSIGINEGNHLGSVSSGNGGAIHFDARGGVAPIRYFVKVDGSTSSTGAGAVGSNGKWYMGSTSDAPPVGLYLSYTDAIRVPTGTTAQRPSGAAGYFRANIDSTNLPEYYDGTTWQALASRNWVRSNFATGNTLYTGDGTLAGNRTVTANNLNLTFNDVQTFRINYDTYVQSKADGTFPYTNVIVAPSQQLWIGYTPTAGTYSKGSAIAIDTNNNVAIGTSVPPTTAPLYADGAAYIHGLQSGRGNFYRVSDFSADHTMTNTEYWANIDASGGNVTITLPAASSVFGSSMGIYYVFRRVDNSGNTVTIQRNGTPGTDTINGASSFTLTTQYEVKEVQCVSTSSFAIK